MVLMAIIMGVNFTSCKPDKETPKKKLAMFSCYEKFKTTFKYDEQGHLIECIDYNILSGSTDIYTYFWNENSIFFTLNLNNPVKINFTLELENGLVSKYIGKPLFFNNFFKYNSYGKLIECQDLMGTISLKWNDDKLITNNYKDSVVTTGIDTYSYDKNYTTEGYNPILSYFITREFLYVAHPEIAGLATQKLYNNETCYSKTSDSEDTNSYKYEYEFDEDGYVNKVIVKKIEENGESILDEYLMTWE